MGNHDHDEDYPDRQGLRWTFNDDTEDESFDLGALLDAHEDDADDEEP